jgi:TAT-translocated FGD2 family F420-dependent dehydrogenase
MQSFARRRWKAARGLWHETCGASRHIAGDFQMYHESSSLPGESFAAVGRRDMLKSAGVLLAASSAGLSAVSQATQASTAQTSTMGTPHRPGASKVAAARDGSSREGSGTLRKGMIAYMLAHEQFPVSELLSLGASAEQAGFDLLAASDHFQPWQANERHCGEAWVTLAALGQRTHHVWMGTTVTCPTLRYNPGVVAETFATLSHLYPGRIFLGLGSGEALNEQAATGSWPAWRDRWDRLIEAVTIIRQLWTGNPLQHQGTHYNVNARLYDPPAKPIPILLAANGPKAMRLAGQHGDGLVTDPQTWHEHKSEWESGAREAGKNPAAMPVLVEAFVTVGGRSDAEAAAKLWNFIPRAFKGYQNIRDPAEIERQAQKDLPLPKVYGDWTVSTDPAAHVQSIKKLFDSGVSIVNIHSGQPEQQKVIEFYGKEVLPKLRNGASPPQ